MAIALSEMRAQVRSELGIGETELPDALFLDYVNMVQIEVAQMLGPVASNSLRKRSAALTGNYSVAVASVNDTGGYNCTTGVFTNFSGLTVNKYAGDTIIFKGTFNTAEVAYKDVIVSNTATTVTGALNSKAAYSGTSIMAIILGNTKSVDPETMGLALPSDCMYPIYLSDSLTPSSENRIELIQADDTEQFLQNEYWDAEVVAALHIGDTVHVMKGDSATFDAIIGCTYVRRPAVFSADTDQLKISQGRLPEEYWGIIRAGILKMAAMHLERRDTMVMQGEDMANRVAAIQRSFSMSDSVYQRDMVTT